MQITIHAHGCFCHDHIYNAIHVENKINRLIKTLMNIEKSDDSIELNDELFKLEYNLSMLVISELKSQLNQPIDQ